MNHQLLFSGNDIFLSKSAQHIGKAYSVLFEKEVFVENDPSKSCKNYPTSHFVNYKVNCHRTFQLVPSSCCWSLVLWQPFSEELNHSFTGLAISTNMVGWVPWTRDKRGVPQQRLSWLWCCQPVQWCHTLWLLQSLFNNICHSKEIKRVDQVSFNSSHSANEILKYLDLTIVRAGDTSMIDLVPSGTLTETKTDFVKTSFTSWLSSFGGALGLWLGLGLCQLVQVNMSSSAVSWIWCHLTYDMNLTSADIWHKSDISWHMTFRYYWHEPFRYQLTQDIQTSADIWHSDISWHKTLRCQVIFDIQMNQTSADICLASDCSVCLLGQLLSWHS